MVVVDDDDVSRKGMAALLAEHPAIDVRASLRHSEAMRWEGWDEVDVALVDAADDRAEGDQFPGVAVVQGIRKGRQPGRVRVVVVTGHFFDDAVRHRMREARADFFYHRSEVADVERLYDVVLNPCADRTVPPANDPEAAFRHGVTDSTRVNDAVAYALERGLPALLTERRDPRSRSWLHLRHQFNRVARLTAVTLDGRPPDREQHLPSLTQIGRFLSWATQTKASPPPTSTASAHQNVRSQVVAISKPARRG